MWNIAVINLGLAKPYLTPCTESPAVKVHKDISEKQREANIRRAKHLVITSLERTKQSKQKIVHALTVKEKMSVSELSKATGISECRIRELLTSMMKDGAILKHKTTPLLWSIPNGCR